MANLKINFDSLGVNCSAANPSQIRIAFQRTGNWSYVGTDSIRVDRATPSLNIEAGNSDGSALSDAALFKQVVLHELGHALGMQHEHQSPDARCDLEFNWETIYATYWQNFRWDRAKVDENLRSLIKSARLRTSGYDKNSIMHYYFPAWMFRLGQASSCFVEHNTTISRLDGESISAAYPSDPAKQVELIKGRERKAKEVLSGLGLSAESTKSISDKINEVVQTAAPGLSVTLVNGGDLEATGGCGQTLISGFSTGAGSSVSISTNSGCGKAP
ncbi:M12 family metallopeptidase [Alsobacter metallidurans]|uniref:M12 family metallopeptidase n=1 Tax=Alsobacter metallidurans TaxID=340221 RepID=UPI001663C4A1|nr:M12 family metallopeptidase [Alsobacter metallidurans]